jgi:hypothetical protein
LSREEYELHIITPPARADARRKSHEIHLVHASPTTAEALNRIGAIYAIEDEIRGKPAEHRSTIRESHARTLLDDLRVEAH